MTKNKTVANSQSVDEFLSSVEHPVRHEDGQTLKAMMERITGCPPVMWGPSIVGFDQYHYKYESGHEGDGPMVAFSPRKSNLSIYIMPGYDEYDQIMSRLGKYKIGKACLYINKLADVDTDVLEELIDATITTMRQRYPKT